VLYAITKHRAETVVDAPTMWDAAVEEFGTDGAEVVRLTADPPRGWLVIVRYTSQVAGVAGRIRLGS
jgi:hypothetical protein